MWIAVLLILALILGGVGLFVEALRWVLIIALVLFLIGAVMGWSRRRVAWPSAPGRVPLRPGAATHPHRSDPAPGRCRCVRGQSYAGGPMSQPRSIFSRELLPASLAIFSTAALASFESLGVAAALPDIATDLGNVALLPWVVTSYLLTSSLATVLAGPFIDSLGVNRMFRISVVIFTATGFGIAFAPSMEILIVLRLLQG